MEDKIFIIGRVEDIVDNGIVVGKHCFGGDAEDVKVKNPRDSGLKERWGELQVGRAVSFTMGEYMNRPYVKDFKLVEKALAEKAEAVKPQPSAIQENIRENMEWKADKIEQSLWWKELGNRIGDGSLERDFPKSHIAIKQQYYKKMSEITGIDFHHQK